MRLTVTDASPLHYLILIGLEFVLEPLYERVLIPDAVASELMDRGAPLIVRQWMEAPPKWVEILPHFVGIDGRYLAPHLDAGESEAIAVALSLQAELVLMDERAGVREARRLDLNVTGTLGVLAAASALSLIDIQVALGRLTQTNFRAPRQLIQDILAADAKRQRPQ